MTQILFVGESELELNDEIWDLVLVATVLIVVVSSLLTRHLWYSTSFSIPDTKSVIASVSESDAKG